MNPSSMQAWLIEAYETDKIEVETAYESLMRQEEAQHRERMDNYAAMRTASLERLVEKYGLIQPPAA